MRALHPGGGSKRLQIAGSSSSDFSGPAMINLSALFHAGPGADDSSRKRSAGGSKCSSGRSSSGRSGGSGGGGGGGNGGGERNGRSGSVHSSSDDDSSDCSEPVSLAGLDYHWQQEALALTSCHLWRIDCQQLYATLRDK